MSKGIAHSYDLDGTLFRQSFVERVGSAIQSKFQPEFTSSSLESIPHLPRTIVDKPVKGITERVAFALHAKRKTFSGVKEMIETAVSKGIDVYGNTGRRNKRLWREMTQKSLTRDGIAGYFQDVFYTPEGAHRVASKVDAIRKLRETYAAVVHHDDDPVAARHIAALFPDVTVFLINYETTGLLLSKDELQKFPNIRRVGDVSQAAINI